MDSTAKLDSAQVSQGHQEGNQGHRLGVQPGTNQTSPEQETTRPKQQTGNQKQRSKQFIKNTNTKAPRHLVEPGSSGRRLAKLKQRLDSEQQMSQRSKGLTVCLVFLVASMSCLSPYLNLHLNQSIGLLLFESDLLQFKLSLINLGASLLILVILHLSILLFLGQNSKRNIIIQKVMRQLLSLFAITSSIAYMSLHLVVPQIKQIQRMPLATFDCNANLITVENCHQQFSSEGGEPSLWQVSGELLAGKLEASSEQLIKKLDCLKYIDNKPNSRKFNLPTRFLLHNCGLVCRPQRPSVHQFGDNVHFLSSNISAASDSFETNQSNMTEKSVNRPLLAPYDRQRQEDQPGESSRSAGIEQDKKAMSISQVSLRVCFSGEPSGGPSYKQFCIDNLANAANQHNQVHSTLTIGQLNAMLNLSATKPTTTSASDTNTMRATIHRERSSSQEFDGIDEQSTQFLNPVVQFESHFKNWPHSSRPSAGSHPNESPASDEQFEDERDNWCRFKPVPPFIVYNKPFSDIQCSLEHEYTISTDSQLGAERIYLKKSSMERGQSESVARERCNIQCKVNILYQVRVDINSPTSADKGEGPVELEAESTQFYLPLKPCVVVSGDGDKDKTVRYYLLLRAIADTTLLLTFILLDLFLLFESIDKLQFQFEAKKLRLVSLLFALALVPLFLALAFDLVLSWSPTEANSRGQSYLGRLLNDTFWHSLSDLYTRMTSDSTNNVKLRSSSRSAEQAIVHTRNRPNQNISTRAEPRGHQHETSTVIDSHLLPPFFYSIFMFILAIHASRLPIPRNPPQLVRISSTEELGIASNVSFKTEEKRTSLDEEDNDDGGNKPDGANFKRNVGGRITVFILLALFMGIQFNLSQLGQRQIFIETLGNPTISSVGRQQQQTDRFQFLWFVLATKSGAAIICLIATIVLFDEISTFLSSLSPFKPTSSISREADESKINEARLLQHSSFALLVYAIRYYALSSVSSNSSFKWLVIFLFQVAEVFNLPLVWFALCARAHELIRELPIYVQLCSGRMKEDSVNSTADREAKWALELHLVVQSVLALIYFALAKSMALFAHTLNASMFLYSDNVDWFISSFYGPPGRHQNSTSKLAPKQDSLFSPLPAERQTYLHASRIFLRYNSLLCLLLGILLLINLFYVKYQLWSEQNRTYELLRRSKSWLARQAFLRGQSDSSSSNGDNRLSGDYIDERLSLDLMRIHSVGHHQSPISQTTITTPAELRTSTQEVGGPRARVLFHYQLDKPEQTRQSTSPSSDSSDCQPNRSQSVASRSPSFTSVEPQESPKSPAQYGQSLSSTLSPDIAGQSRQDSNISRETRIPIALEESLDGLTPDKQPSPSAGSVDEEDVEVVSKTHKKRVRIVERHRVYESNQPATIDEPQSAAWRRDQTKPMAVNYGLPKVITTNRYQATGTGNKAGTKATTKRAISFAPTTTLIGHDGLTERHLAAQSSSRDSQSVTPQRASPEPSIEGGSSIDGANDADSIEFEASHR